MLSIEFVPLFSSRIPTLSDVPYLRIDQSTLRAGPTDEVIATYENHQWLRAGFAYAVVRIPSRCQLRFDDESTVHGPYDGVQLQSEYIRVSLSTGPVFAELDDSGKWHVHSTGKRHSVVIIEPAT